MRDKIGTMCVTLTALLVTPSSAMAQVQLKDGQTYDIYWLISDDVWVDYVAPGIGTTVDFTDGGGVASLPFSGGYDVRAFEDSIVNISGGSIGRDFRAYDRNRLTLSSGSIGRHLYAYDGSDVTVSGGTVDVQLLSYDTSHVTVSGGSIGYGLSASGSSQVTVSGGSMGGSLHVHDTTQATLSGGSIAGNLSASGSSQVTVSGGSMGGTLYASDGSHVTVSGGSIAENLVLAYLAILTINGSDFAVDGQPVGYGEITSILRHLPTNEPPRRLTGTMRSGDPIDNNFWFFSESVATVWIESLLDLE